MSKLWHRCSDLRLSSSGTRTNVALAGSCPRRICTRYSPPANARHLSQLIQVPLIFTGLALTLWAWKCLMLVVFQNKIIYMPYLSRYDDSHNHLFEPEKAPWTARRLESADGVKLVFLERSLPSNSMSQRDKLTQILYLQGNASATPARLPFLGKIAESVSRVSNAHFHISALSYRGYWRSRGRPSEVGILLDVQAMLNLIQSHLEQQLSIEQPAKEVTLVLWGHSVGAGFSVLSLDRAITMLNQLAAKYKDKVRIRLRLVLETPFCDTTKVLHELYPQRWLPYRYLGPFLRTKLDMPAALSRIGRDRLVGGILESVHIIAASQDEILGEPSGLPRQVFCAFEQALQGSDVRITFDVVKGLHANLLTTSAFRHCITKKLTKDHIGFIHRQEL